MWVVYDSGEQASGLVSLWFRGTEVILFENEINDRFPAVATIPRINKSVK